MGRAERVTSALKSHDYNLFCKSMEGKLCIYRRTKRVESYEYDGKIINFVRPVSDFVLALTHNWKESGYAVDWGVEPVMDRLRSIDLWNVDIVSQLEKQEEQREKESEAKRKHETEDFLYEFHGNFKKTFSDVNVGNLSKKTKNKRRL